LGATFSWVDFKFTEFQPGVDHDSLIQTERVGRPRFQYGVNARYDLPVRATLGEPSLSAHWGWQSISGTPEQYVGPGAEIPAYGLLTVGANWNRIAGSAIDATFFMTNALNKTYVTNPQSLYNTFGVSFTSYGEPRMYGLRLRYTFDKK
jgi:iron complex outermembrane recepter protein